MTNNFKYRQIKTGVLVFYNGIVAKGQNVVEALERAVRRWNIQGSEK